MGLKVKHALCIGFLIFFIPSFFLFTYLIAGSYMMKRNDKELSNIETNEKLEINELEIIETDDELYIENSNYDVIDNNKEMTIEEGYIEIDSIFNEFRTLTVDECNFSEFDKLCKLMDYDTIITLTPGQPSEIVLKLYDIIEEPKDNNKLQIIQKRLSDFVVLCPNFYEDDRLNHKYEFMCLLMRDFSD